MKKLEKQVSIQPLFRWNSHLSKVLHFRQCFNTTIVSVEQLIANSVKSSLIAFQYNHCFGGTCIAFINNRKTLWFQYNHCFGGTILWREQKIILKSFNTTIVSVERSYAKRNILWKFVSIQPLFRWNLDRLGVENSAFRFQYNHCFGGTKIT